MTMDAEHLSILKRRASELSKRPVKEDPSAWLDVLEVAVAGRRLGLEVRHVQQIVPNQGMCRLPQEGGALLGLVNSRGSAVPVADLAALLGDSEPDAGRDFIVLIDGASPVGVLVDAVSIVRRVHAHDVRARSSGPPGDVLERGLTPDDLVVLDGDVLLADPRLHHRSGHEHLPEHPMISDKSLQERHAPHDHR